MKKFNDGAARPATGDARPSPLAAANDLVRRTLAQHGLTAPGTGQHPGTAPGLPTMDGLLAGLQSPLTGAPAVHVPDGAEFRSDQFTCTAGSRAYRTYTPSTAADGVEGVVLMLHGCTQTPEDFAIGTGMNALAETHRLVVVYPGQSRGENAQSCWNWFSPAISAATRASLRSWRGLHGAWRVNSA